MLLNQFISFAHFFSFKSLFADLDEEFAVVEAIFSSKDVLGFFISSGLTSVLYKLNDSVNETPCETIRLV